MNVKIPCSNCRKQFWSDSMTLTPGGRYLCRASVCQPYVPAPPCAVCGAESDDRHPTLGSLCAAHDPRYQPADGEEVMQQ